MTWSCLAVKIIIIIIISSSSSSIIINDEVAVTLVSI